MEFWLPSDEKKHDPRIYSAGKLYAKEITTMIDSILNVSPNPFSS